MVPAVAELRSALLGIAWVADITYIRILKGFVFLAALLDRYSRKAIGWAISKRIDAELCLAALKSALAKRQPPAGCIHHSDRGVQYACREYVALVQAAHMKISMSRIGNPYDNAHMESFFKTLKYEEVHLSNYETFDDVTQGASQFLGGGVQEETVAFGSGIPTARGIRNEDSENQNCRSRTPQISVKSLQWEGRTPVRLRPEISKTKDGRVLPLHDELLDVIGRAQAKRTLECPFVFHLKGKPVGDFRKAWKTATKAAGLAGVIVHDLRRTAIRNMVRAGVHERVVMSLSGHKTRSIFDRYNIVSEDDLVRASEMLHSHLQKQAKAGVIYPLKKAAG